LQVSLERLLAFPELLDLLSQLRERIIGLAETRGRRVEHEHVEREQDRDGKAHRCPHRVRMSGLSAAACAPTLRRPIAPMTIRPRESSCASVRPSATGGASARNSSPKRRPPVARRYSMNMRPSGRMRARYRQRTANKTAEARNS